MRVLARAEQVVPLVVAHRPVEVLARSVDAGERLLVQQAGQAELRREAAHRLHDDHLVIGGDVRVLEHRRDLVLARRHFVVARLDRHADLVQLALGLVHERHHALGDRAEVLILELLALRRLRAEQRAAGVDQIGTRQVEVLIDQEVFLLGPARRDDALGVRAEQLQHADRLLRERFHRAQQRRLLVERLTRPAHERGRDDERDGAAGVEQPRRARRIPRRVAARLEGGAHAARREARRVGLALDQFLAAEFGDGLAVAVRAQKRVVLFGGDAGQRLEPVRVVRRAVLDRPFLHRRRDRVRDRGVERIAVRDRPPQRLIHRLRQARLLHAVVEHQAAERLGRVRSARRASLRFFTDQSRIALIASPSTAEPMTSPPFTFRSRLFSRANKWIAHDIARWLKRALFADFGCLCNENEDIRDAPVFLDLSGCQPRVFAARNAASGQPDRLTSDGPFQPSTTRNSASTMAVAPQISSSPTRNAGTAMRLALALALRRDHRSLRHQVVDRHFENPRDLAVGRRERRRAIARADDRVQPESADRDVDRRERARESEDPALSREISSCASRSAACSNASPGSMTPPGSDTWPR